MTHAISVSGLGKSFGQTRALDGLDLTVSTGEVHGLLAYVPGDVTLWPSLSGGEVIRGYSKGNRQKVALVAAFASDVEPLILDEPTSGVDPLMEAVFRDRVTEERARGRAVLLSSHILFEVEALCDRVSRTTITTITADLTTPRPASRTSPASTTSPSTAIGSGSTSTTTPSTPSSATSRRSAPALTSQPPTLEELFPRHYETAPRTSAERDPGKAMVRS